MITTNDPEILAMRKETAALTQKARVEYEHYRIFREIKETERNRKLLDTFFPPETGSLTYAAFKHLVDLNPDLISKFEFRTNSPYLQELQEEKERGDAEAKGYHIFADVCEQLGAAGTADIAQNQANWSLVKEYLNNLPVTTANISKVLTEQQGFVANSGNQVAVWKRDKELRERTQLCRTIAADYSLDPEAREHRFTKTLTGTDSLETLRQKVQEIELRRNYRSMPKESLAATARAQTEQRGEAVAHKLPQHVTPKEINSWDAAKMRKMAQFYGFEALNNRLRGIA